MKQTIRIAAALCCLSGVLVTAGPSNVRATGPAAFPNPGPGIVATIGGYPTSISSLALSSAGPLTASGSKVIVNRGFLGLWSIDPTTLAATRLAGDGTSGYGGDGGPALEASFSNGAPVVVDPSGQIYLADTSNERIRKIDSNGIVSTVAGTGLYGYSGDGGSALDATFNYPKAVARLADGTLFVLDYANFRIRRIAPNGIISTYAGNGSSTVSTGDGGTATSAALGATPTTPLLADASGNLYFIADTGARIRKVAADQTISTVAGNGLLGPGADGVSATSTAINSYSLVVAPSGEIVIGQPDRIRHVIGGTITALATISHVASYVAVGPSGTLYYSDGQEIFSNSSGTETLIGGSASVIVTDGQQASNVELSPEKSIVLLHDGSLVTSEYGAGLVRKIGTDGVVSTLAGGGLTPPATGVAAKDASICPRGLARDALDTIMFVDDCSSAVYAIDAGGNLDCLAGCGTSAPDGVPATQASLDSPHGFATDGKGTLFIDTAGAVLKVDTNGIISRYAGTGVPGYAGDGGAAKFAQIGYNAELAVDPQGDLYISEHDFDVIRRVTPDGKIDTYAGGGPGPSTGDGGPAIHATFSTPENIVVDSVGNLYIADKYDQQIRRVFRTNGYIESIAGDGSRGQRGDGGPAIAADFESPYGIAIDPRGTVYVGDDESGRLRIIGGPNWNGSYVSLPPSRILDTREGVGAPKALVGQQQSIDLNVLGVGGVPATGVSGVIMNVTAVNATNSSFVTVWPTGQGRPTASSLNFSADETIPNTVTAQVGVNGRVSLFNNTGSVDLVADVVGYFTTNEGLGARQVSLTPSRILDTRLAVGVPSPGKVQGGSSISVKVLGVGGVPQNTGVSAVILNVTATEPDASSFVTAYPTGETRPLASSLNFVAGQTIPNQVIAKVGANGSIDLFNNTGSVHLVADVVGYFTQAGDPIGSVVSLFSPSRILDTRIGLGVPVVAQVGQAGTINLKVAGVGGVPATGVKAVVLNLTATESTAPSFVTVWPTGSGRPLASSLNFGAGETIPNQVIAKVGPDGSISLYNNTGSVDLVADVVGYYT